MPPIPVTADVSGSVTLVRLEAPSNMLCISVTADVSGSVTLVRLLAPKNMAYILVTLLVSQALRSWLNAVLFSNAPAILVNWETSQVVTRSVVLFQLMA